MPPEEILIIDDNAINLKLLQLLLQGAAGYVTHTASDAPEALAALNNIHPSLILMDLQLPGMDGIELTKRLKAGVRTSDIPIVAVTAYAMKGDEERARAAGCDGYITKPFDTRTLAATVAGFLPSSAPEIWFMSNILLIDDTRAFREPLAFALRHHGHFVACADHGLEALALLTRYTPDMILLDITMPVMDGQEFLTALRGDPRWDGVPVILLSTMNQTDLSAQVGDLGVVGILKKSQLSLVQLLWLLAAMPDAAPAVGLGADLSDAWGQTG